LEAARLLALVAENALPENITTLPKWVEEYFVEQRKRQGSKNAASEGGGTQADGPFECQKCK